MIPGGIPVIQRFLQIKLLLDPGVSWEDTTRAASPSSRVFEESSKDFNLGKTRDLPVGNG